MLTPYELLERFVFLFNSVNVTYLSQYMLKCSFTCSEGTTIEDIENDINDMADRRDIEVNYYFANRFDIARHTDNTINLTFRGPAYAADKE